METYDTVALESILNCSRAHVQRICKSGELRAFKVGVRWVVTKTDLENYIAAKHHEREQAVIDDRSEQLCQSTLTSTGYGKYPFAHQAAKELDALLKRPTEKRPKSCTIN